MMSKRVWTKQKLVCLYDLLQCIFSQNIFETVKFDRFSFLFHFVLLLFFQAQRIQVLHKSCFHKVKIWRFEVGSEIPQMFSHVHQENESSTRSSSIHEYSFHVSDELSLRKCLQLIYDQKCQKCLPKEKISLQMLQKISRILSI